MRSLKVDIKLRLGMRQWVLGKPLADLLSLRHLTSLDYDTGGYLQRLTDYTGTHRCRSISAMLPSLRRLRCRMEMMCEDFLEPPPGEAPLALEEVIVHLSTSGRTRKGKAVYLMAESCQFPDVYHFIHLRELMEKQARALLVRLANPRMVRVITHENIEGYTMPYAFDVMKEERIRLPKNSKWDAEGEVVDEGGVPQWTSAAVDEVVCKGLPSSTRPTWKKADHLVHFRLPVHELFPRDLIAVDQPRSSAPVPRAFSIGASYRYIGG
jgi:hypothetical protein